MASDLDDNWQLPDAPASASSAPKPGELDDNWKLPDTNPKYGSFWDNVKGDAKFAGRQIALGARGAVQGVEGLPMMALDTGVDITNMAKKGLNMLGLDKDPTYMQRPSVTNDQDLTAAGVPAPQNTGEQLVAGTAGMLAGARLPQGQMPETPGQPLAPNVGTPAPGQTAGQVTGNTGIQSVESTVGRMVGGTPIREAVATQRSNITADLSKQVDALAGESGTTPYSVGAKLDPAIRQGAKDLKEAAGSLFDIADSKIPTSTPVTPMVTQAFLAAKTAIPAGASAMGKLATDPQMQRWAAAIASDAKANGGTVPYSALKQILSQVNDKIDWTGLNGGAQNGLYKQLYLSMRQDLNAAADSVGGEAGAAVRQANKSWQDATSRLDSLNNALSGNGGAEQIFNRLFSGAKLGPSGLMAVMDHIPDSSQRVLAAGVLQRMGKSASGDFSADTFVQNWGKMDPDAKNRLFGSLPQEYQKNVNTLVQNIRDVQAYQKVLPNASGTASASQWLGTIGTYQGAITALLTGHPKIAAGLGVAAAGSTVGANIAAKALTNPRIVQWLARESAPSKVLGLSGAAAGADYGTPEKQGSAVGR